MHGDATSPQKKRESNFQVSAALMLCWHPVDWETKEGRRQSFKGEKVILFIIPRWMLSEMGSLRWGRTGSAKLRQQTTWAALKCSCGSENLGSALPLLPHEWRGLWAYCNNACQPGNLSWKKKNKPERNSLEKIYKSLCFDPTALMKTWQ